MTTSPNPRQEQREISERPRQKDKKIPPPTPDNGVWYKSIRRILL
jgi:hypothetical protein